GLDWPMRTSAWANSAKQSMHAARLIYYDCHSCPLLLTFFGRGYFLQVFDYRVDLSFGQRAACCVQKSRHGRMTLAAERSYFQDMFINLGIAVISRCQRRADLALGLLPVTHSAVLFEQNFTLESQTPLPVTNTAIAFEELAAL